jgi:hypothetical protein
MANVTAPETETPQVDDALLVKAANMNIHQYVPKKSPGHYDEQVETLLKVDEQTGFQNSIEIYCPTAEVKKHKRWFNTSAKNFERGSRIVNGDLGVADGDGGSILEFVLTDLIKLKSKEEREAEKAAKESGKDAPTPA